MVRCGTTTRRHPAWRRARCVPATRRNSRPRRGSRPRRPPHGRATGLPKRCAVEVCWGAQLARQLVLRSWSLVPGPRRLVPRLELGDHVIDAAGHVKVLLGNLVVLALDDLLEPADGVGNLHVLALVAGELLRDEERL